jgi:hypothetical protein
MSYPAQSRRAGLVTTPGQVTAWWCRRREIGSSGNGVGGTVGMASPARDRPDPTTAVAVIAAARSTCAAAADLTWRTYETVRVARLTRAASEVLRELNRRPRVFTGRTLP